MIAIPPWLIATSGCLLLALPASPPESRPALTPRQIAEAASPAVVLFQAEGNDELRQSTGFVVDSSGSIVTALHALDKAARVKVTLPGGQRFEEVGILAFDVEQDLAIVHVDIPQKGDRPTPVELGKSSSVGPGDTVVVISNPLGLTLTLTQGIVSAWREPKADGVGREAEDEDSMLPLPTRRLLQISAAISPGSSGGPVFNEHGEVIGIAMAGILYGLADLNFAVPIDDVPRLLREDRPMDLGTFHQQVQRARLDLARPPFEAAQLAYERGEVKTALRHLNKALLLFPAYEKALLLSGDIRVAAGELGEAERLFLRVIEANDENAEAWYRLATVYDEMAADGNSLSLSDRARSAYERCLSVDPQHARAAYSLALLHLRRGNLVQAEQLLRDATEADSSISGAHAMLGLILLARGRLGEAEAAFRKGLWEDGEQPLSYFGLAQLSMLQENTRGDAARHWARFMELSRGDPSLRREREIALRIVERHFPELLRR